MYISVQTWEIIKPLEWPWNLTWGMGRVWWDERQWKQWEKQANKEDLRGYIILKILLTWLWSEWANRKVFFFPGWGTEMRKTTFSQSQQFPAALCPAGCQSLDHVATSLACVKVRLGQPSNNSFLQRWGELKDHHEQDARHKKSYRDTEKYIIKLA